MVRKFPEFSRFSLIFFKKVPFSRFSRFSLSRTNPENSQNEQTHVTEKDVTTRKYEQSRYPLIEFFLFISIHKMEGRYLKY